MVTHQSVLYNSSNKQTVILLTKTTRFANTRRLRFLSFHHRIEEKTGNCRTLCHKIQYVVVYRPTLFARYHYHRMDWPLL